MSFPYNNSKRSAEEYDMDHHTKKPRFDVRNPSALAPDAPEEDVTLDADVIGVRGQRIKRGAVNVDGYDSDSDNENFDVRAATRSKDQGSSAKTKEEDENDMFADLEADLGDNEDNEEKREGKTKKNVKFLDEDDIEGQVRSSKSGGHVSADFSLNGKGKGHAKEDDEVSSEDSEDEGGNPKGEQEVDEEVGAGGKKTHAPKLDAFNMRNENEEGRFDEHGNYVRKATDPDAVHDTWLEGISKKEMKRASEAHEKREKERREKAIMDDAKSDGDLLKLLLPILQPTETVLEALARLNRAKTKKGRWHNRQKQKHSEEGAEVGTEPTQEEKAEEERSKAIITMTEAADLLLGRGQSEIYHTEKELLIRQYRQATGDNWVEPSADEPGSTTTEDWQYRWSDNRDGGEAHGPYDSATIRAWIDAGYFDENVEYRNGDNNTWTRDPVFV